MHSLTGEKHLSRSALHLLLSGEFPAGQLAAATQHLQSCTPCRECYETLSRDVEELAEEDLREQSHLTRRQLERTARLPRGKLAAVAAGLILAVAAAFVGDRLSPALMASQQLERAAAQQAMVRTGGHYVVLKSGGRTCAMRVSPQEGEVRQVVSQFPGFCQSVRMAMGAIDWRWDDPLSAAAFQNWRTSLKQKTDEVIQGDAVTVVRTSTPEGALKAASLSLRTADAHPFAVLLEPVQGPKIDLLEQDQEPEEFRQARLHTPERAPNGVETPVESVPELVDPVGVLDDAETRVRLALHQVGADTGFETAIRRLEGRIVVVGVAATPERKEEIADSLNGISAVSVEVRVPGIDSATDDAFAPPTPQTGEAPPLASLWLKEHFATRGERVDYSNRVLALARDLAGRAFVADEIRGRLPMLVSAGHANQLRRVLDDHEAALARTSEELRVLLETLAGSLNQRSQVAHAAEVQELRTAILSLFAVSQPEGSAENQIAVIRQFFQP